MNMKHNSMFLMFGIDQNMWLTLTISYRYEYWTDEFTLCLIGNDNACFSCLWGLFSMFSGVYTLRQRFDTKRDYNMHSQWHLHKGSCHSGEDHHEGHNAIQVVSLLLKPLTPSCVCDACIMPSSIMTEWKEGVFERYWIPPLRCDNPEDHFVNKATLRSLGP